MTLFKLAQRYVGEITEKPGAVDHPWILWALSLCGFTLNAHDEIPWCSAAVNTWAWELRLPRSKSAAARSWLQIGVAVELKDATADYCVVVLQRGTGEQPGPEVIAAAGHVGLFAGMAADRVLVLGGNQGNGISIESFPASRVLGVRRLK